MSTTNTEQRRRQRIRVPTRLIQGGFDVKFETDPYNVKLHGILSPEEYTQSIDLLNRRIKPARSNSVDKFLLMTGPLMVPLALWGARHGLQVRKRKRLLRDGIREFNDTHPELLMRYNRGGPESFLTIEVRQGMEDATPVNGVPMHPGESEHYATATATPIPGSSLPVVAEASGVV